MPENNNLSSQETVARLRAEFDSMSRIEPVSFIDSGLDPVLCSVVALDGRRYLDKCKWVVDDRFISYGIGYDLEGNCVYQSWSGFDLHRNALGDPKLLFASADPVELVADSDRWRTQYLAETPRYSVLPQTLVEKNDSILCRSASEAVRELEAWLPMYPGESVCIRDNHNNALVGEADWERRAGYEHERQDGLRLLTEELRQAAVAEGIQSRGNQLYSRLIEICINNPDTDVAARQADDLVQQFGLDVFVDSQSLRQTVRSFIQSSCADRSRDSDLLAAIRKFEASVATGCANVTPLPEIRPATRPAHL